MSHKLILFKSPSSDEPYSLVQIQPYVLLSILDSHLRRDATQKRVIGALLGDVEDDVVNIRNCYQIPHIDSDKDDNQVRVNLDLFYTLLDMNRKLNPNLSIVGWYTTGESNSNSQLHNFFEKETNRSPIYMLVDPEVREQTNFICYYKSEIELGSLQNLYLFKPIEYRYTASLQDKVALETLSQINRKESVPVKSLDSVVELLDDILQTINNVQKFIQSVIKGEIPPNNNIAIAIEEVLAHLPTNEEDFNNIFSSSLQDLLMISYLANLSKKQLEIAQNVRYAVMENETNSNQTK